MNIKENIRQRKIIKIRKLIDVRLAKMKSSYILVTPGVNGWPQIPYDIVFDLSKGDSIAYPLAIRFKDRYIVDFIIVGSNPVDIWNVWTSIITTAYADQDKFSNYRITVFNHILIITPDFKEKLEKVLRSSLPFFQLPPPIILKELPSAER